MSIIRLARTYPRKNQQGIGLNCYNLSCRINQPTIVFTKWMESEPIDIPNNVHLEEISYKDLSFNSKQETKLRLLLILCSKIWGELFFSIQVFRYLFKEKTKIKLIHLHTINYLFTACLLKLWFRAPLVINFGGTDLVRFSQYRLLQKTSKLVDKVFYVARAMEPKLKKFFDIGSLVYMGNGVDLDLFKPSKVDRQKQFIAVGNLRWQKGYLHLLDAFRNVVDKDNDYRLLIAGEGPDRLLIEERIKELDLGNNVNLLGMCSRKEITSMLNSSRAFVMASVSEGFPKAMIEAIACATPVVVTDVGECAQIANGVGFVVPVKDSNALGSSMMDIAFNDIFWDKFSSQCIKIRKNYSWQRVSDRVNNIYLNMLQP